MAKRKKSKEEKAAQAASQKAGGLAAMLERGDWRGARKEALRLQSDPNAGAPDKEEALKALARTVPEKRAMMVFGIGLALVLFVIYFGLLRH
jgi:hypothetical protein